MTKEKLKELNKSIKREVRRDVAEYNENIIKKNNRGKQRTEGFQEKN